MNETSKATPMIGGILGAGRTMAKEFNGHNCVCFHGSYQTLETPGVYCGIYRAFQYLRNGLGLEIYMDQERYGQIY